MIDRNEHWEHIYATKSPEELSWTQYYPEISVKLITELSPNFNAPIIDIGGGDSKLADALLDLGYTDITVLDISLNAMKRAQTRLGDRANQIKWIHSDILNFIPTRKYGIWHDRAAFHFLNQDGEVEVYKQLVSNYVYDFLLIATFAADGPLKCSGLEVRRYSDTDMAMVFGDHFKVVKSFANTHTTPFATEQKFFFEVLKKV